MLKVCLSVIYYLGVSVWLLVSMLYWCRVNKTELSVFCVSAVRLSVCACVCVQYGGHNNKTRRRRPSSRNKQLLPASHDRVEERVNILIRGAQTIAVRSTVRHFDFSACMLFIFKSKHCENTVQKL